MDRNSIRRSPRAARAERRRALDEGIVLFRAADPRAAERLAIAAAPAQGFLDEFDRDLALFYLSEHHRIHGFEAMFRGRVADALRRLEAAVACSDANFQALYGVAVCANATGDYARAVEALRQLSGVERCPTRLATHLAVALVNAGRCDEAAALLEPAIAAHPRFADLNFVLGICRWKQRRPVEAVAHLRASLAANPRFGAARARLAAALVLTGALAEASRVLPRDPTRAPESARIDELRDTLQASGARRKAAVSEFQLRKLAEKLATEEMYTPLPIHSLSIGLHVTDDEVGAGPSYHEALAGAYEQLVNALPHLAHLRYRLGRLLERLGRSEEARSHYLRAVELDPRNAAWPGVAALLGDALPEGARDAKGPPRPTGRYDESRDGVKWEWDPSAVPAPCFAAHLVRRVGWLRRSIDTVVSASALLLLSPVFLVVALAIRLESAGPVFFRQTRVGWNGHRFTIFKFRTMVKGADENETRLDALNDADGPMFKIKNDPRVTRVGRFLRKRSLDELPQFWNVLRGDMTLIGPRPLIEREVGQMTDWELHRLRVRPGLACLAQICGRSDLLFHEWIRLDTYYVSKQGPRMDLGIAWRAVESVLAGRGAY